MGVEVHTERLWRRADEEGLARLVFVNMLDRERADFFRCLESLKSAFGPHVVATEIPIGSEHEVRGVIDLIDMTAFEYTGDGRGNAKQIEIPDELRDAGRGVPREAHGRGRRELRRAHGALPRGRGDLPRGARHGAQAGRQRGPPVPGHLRRRDSEPGHQPAAGGAGRGPARRRRCAAPSRPPTPRASRSRSSPTRTASCSPTCSRPPPIPTRGGSTCCASTPASSRRTPTSRTRPSARRSASASSPHPRARR